MAERVQFHIEGTIPEMEQMERIGLFTKPELKRMIKKRKFLEYALRRRNKKKEHFLKCIQYEMAVLDLLEMRRKRLQCNFKKQEIEFSIARRINKLFQAAIELFQNDVSLWISQIKFCKRMKLHYTIRILFSRVLQIHGSNPGLWILNAKWEMEENNAPENARQLLQRGLCLHPNSQLLWTEYFRMELMYTDLVLKRREILSVQEIKDVGSESDAVLQGVAASFVYKNATQVIPDIEFALSFIPICQDFDFADSHIEEIFCDIQFRHPNSEETLDALARRPLIDLKKKAECGKTTKAGQNAEMQAFSLYEKALEKVLSQKMWTFYINFTVSRMESAKKKKMKSKLCTKVINLMERASTAACLLQDFYPYWANLVQARGDRKTALSVALTACRMWPKNLKLWLFCLTLHIQTNQDNEQISELFDEALVNIKQKNSFPVWQLAVLWQSVVNPSELSTIFESGIMGCKNVSLPMKEMYLEMIALKKDIHAVRNLYKRLRYMFPTSTKFYKKMIEIENAQLNSSIKWLRIYYEDAVKEFGESDVDLWLDYIKLEIEHPDSMQTNVDFLYRRAMEALSEDLTEDFTTRFTLFSTGHG